MPEAPAKGDLRPMKPFSSSAGVVGSDENSFLLNLRFLIE